MVTILAGLATFERHLVKARTSDGRARAKARGVRFGRKAKLTPHQISEAIQRKEAGERLRDIARSPNVSHSTISRLQHSRQKKGSPEVTMGLPLPMVRTEGSNHRLGHDATNAHADDGTEAGITGSSTTVRRYL